MLKTMKKKENYAEIRFAFSNYWAFASVFLDELVNFMY